MPRNTPAKTPARVGSRYKELQTQMEKLQTQMEAVRAEESHIAIAECKAMIEFYDLKPFELFGTIKMQTLPPKKEKKSDKTFGPTAVKQTKNPPKYRDPASGATWTGMGKQPYWIEGNRDDYLIENLQDKPKRITQNNKEERQEETALH